MEGSQTLFCVLAVWTTLVILILISMYRMAKTKGTTIYPFMTKLWKSPQQQSVLLGCSASIRTVVPPILFNYLHPINAMLINQTIVDNIDPFYWNDPNIPQFNWRKYETWDKCFDIYGYSIALIPVWKTDVFTDFPGWGEDGVRIFLSSLLAWRFCGLIAWFLTKKDKIWLFFPDLYTAAYYTFSLADLWNFKDNTKAVNGILVSSFILKILVEYLHHFTLLKGVRS